MLKEIPVSNITCLPNYRTIGIDKNSQKFKDLVESVKRKGVMQAGLVRPNPGKEGHYQLVFGNQRFSATLEAGLPIFPATVKDVPDDEVLELQVMENLQRNDVHPMDEAAAYKAYQEKKNVDVKELAAVFAKTERYITNRLQLTNLIDILQKDYLKGMITTGEAEIFSKLDAAQQKELREYTYSSYNKRYMRTAKELSNRIEEAFLLKLDAAPWKRDDADLVPAAGACSSCQKRTSCKGLLFVDIVKSDDRCLDKKCYKSKADAFFIREVEKIATTKPDIVFLKSGSDNVNPAVKKLIDQYKITVLDYYSNGVTSYKSSNTTPQKCFQITGYDKGKYVTVYVQAKAKAAAAAKAGDTSPAAVKEQIAAIQQRLDRSKELDYEKVQDRVVKAIEEISPDDKPLDQSFDLKQIDRFLLILCYAALTWGDDDLMEAIGLGDGVKAELKNTPDLLFEKIVRLPVESVSSMIRNALMNKFRTEKRVGIESFVIRQLAECLGVDVKAIVAEQNAIAAKREENATKRIEALQKESKAAKPKPAAAANKIAPGVNKTAKKAISKPKKKSA